VTHGTDNVVFLATGINLGKQPYGQPFLARKGSPSGIEWASLLDTGLMWTLDSGNPGAHT